MNENRSAPPSWDDPESFYAVLGVSETADQSSIALAARRLIRKLHPDIAPGHEARIALVMEAQEVLTHPDKRRRYDEHRRLRKLEQERLRRAQEAAAAAARAAAEEARAARIAAHERRVAEERRWGVAEEHAPEAPQGTQSTPKTYSATFSWTGHVDWETIRGQDHFITVTGHRGCFHEGFRFTAESDGELVSVRAGLQPGVYRFEGRGWFAPYGGPRGDLIMRYSWPPPLRGADLHVSVGRRGKDHWVKRTFTAPVTGDQLTIPAGAGSTPIRYAGQGSVGEFGGPPGDLIVEVVFDGRPRSRLAHRFVKGAKFVLIVIGLVCAGLIIGGVVVSAFT